MKIKIFEPVAPQSDELLLRLVSKGESVSLVVCDSDGNIVKGGYILRITADGTLHKFDNISSELGLRLSPKCKIKED